MDVDPKRNDKRENFVELLVGALLAKLVILHGCFIRSTTWLQRVTDHAPPGTA